MTNQTELRDQEIEDERIRTLVETHTKGALARITEKENFALISMNQFAEKFRHEMYGYSMAIRRGDSLDKILEDQHPDSPEDWRTRRVN